MQRKSLDVAFLLGKSVCQKSFHSDKITMTLDQGSRPTTCKNVQIKHAFLLWKSAISQLYLNSVIHHQDSGFDAGRHAGWGMHKHDIE